MKRIPMIAAFAVFAAMPISQHANAQALADNPAAGRHAEGLLMEHRGDDKGAFVAFLEAAQGGYPPAQRRLGEIYDSGNAAVERDYEESIRWYQKAREGGEVLPAQKSYGTYKPAPIRVGP